jgi:hypothetical protein
MQEALALQGLFENVIDFIVEWGVFYRIHFGLKTLVCSSFLDCSLFFWVAKEVSDLKRGYRFCPYKQTCKSLLAEI